jgi:hypothetical protein
MNRQIDVESSSDGPSDGIGIGMEWNRTSVLYTVFNK